MKILSTEHIWEEITHFLKSADFSKAVLLGISLTLPILAGIYFDLLEMGIAVTVGTMLASPSNVSGSIRNKLNGIFLSTIIAASISLLGGYLRFSPVPTFIALGVLMFAISYISIFGFRASLISFSGLFALVLSFSPLSGDLSPPDRSLLIGLGGLWFAGMTYLWHVFFPKGPTEFYLSRTFNLTSEYLQIRGKMADKTNDRSVLLTELLHIQTELTETHEVLRSILISNRSGSGKSFYEGKRLLIFALLIDMLELAMANPVNYAKTDDYFEAKPGRLTEFQNLLFAMADRLEEIGTNLSNPKKLASNSEVRKHLDLIYKQIEEYIPTFSSDQEEDLLLLRNLYKYQAEQVKNIEKIEWLFKESDRNRIRFIKNEDAKKFLTREDFNLKVISENFNFHSPIFRHSLRIAVTTMIGYGIGIAFEVQNAFWILLTIIVIMRPNFGLTKKRSIERTIGTLIGGALAFLFVLFIDNNLIYGGLAIITLIISFSMIQRNYKAAATFITLNVIFIYTLFTPNIFDVIQFRIIDTLIGTGLAITANLLLWPAWEINNMQNTLLNTVRAYRIYFEEITEYYKQKGEISQQYKVMRKKAFIEMSNLSAAFQRMSQEPISKQENLERFYEIVELNQTFLSSLASLSTYIINNPTTPASKNFELISSHIINNLLKAEALLQNQELYFEENLTEIEDIFDVTFGHSIPLSGEEMDPDKIEEAHLLREQLKWLLAMSEKLPKLILETPME